MNLFQNYTKFFDNLGQVVSENTYQDWQKIFRRALSYSKESGNLSERCFWPRIHSEILHNLALNSNTNSDYDQLIQSAVDSCLASSTAAGQLTMKARNSLDLKGEQFWHRQRAESLYRATEYIQDKETLHEILERATAFYLSSASIAGQLILQSDERKDMADSYLWRTVRGRLYLKAAEIASHDRSMDEYLSRALVDFQSAEGLAGLIVKHALEHEDLEGQQEWRRKRAEMCSSAADLMHGSERSKKNSDAVNLYKAAASLAGQLAIRARDANRLEEVLRWHTERAISSEKAAKFVDDIDSVNELQKVAYDYYSASAAVAGQLFLEARSAGDIQQQQSLLEVRAERTVDAARMAKTKESMRFLNDSARGYFSGAADLANELVFRARNANKIDDVQHWLCKYSSMLLRAASLTSDDSSKCDNFVKEGLVGIDLMYDYRLSGLGHAPIFLPRRHKRGGVRDHRSVSGGDNWLKCISQMLGDGANTSIFENKLILDIGCGNRAAEAILKKRIPVAKYVGVEVDKELVDALNEQTVMTGQFEFHHLDCYNALYNPNGSVFLSKNTPLINTHDARFDYILAGSLFSHLGISDASNYFSSLLQYSTNNTKFVFSLFLDVNVVDVHDADSVSHMRILYNPRTAESLLRDAGWEIERAYLQDWKMRAYVPEWNAVPLNSIAGIPSGRQSFLLARRLF